MSFGVTKEQLTKSIAKLRKAICFYTAPPCDCKYMGDDGEIGRSECSGCPELYQAMALIEAMTPTEFERIRKRAKIVISEIDFYKEKP